MGSLATLRFPSSHWGAGRTAWLQTNCLVALLPCAATTIWKSSRQETHIRDRSACIAGFCAVSKFLPLPQSTEIEITLPPVEASGVNAAFNTTVHCVAAEPHSTFVRVTVTDDGREVAYDCCVLARLRRGLRVLQMRASASGTRIELCYLFVSIHIGMVVNLWPSARQLRMQYSIEDARWARQEETIDQLKQRLTKRLDEENHRHQGSCCV